MDFWVISFTFVFLKNIHLCCHNCTTVDKCWSFLKLEYLCSPYVFPSKLLCLCFSSFCVLSKLCCLYSSEEGSLGKKVKINSSDLTNTCYPHNNYSRLVLISRFRCLLHYEGQIKLFLVNGPALSGPHGLDLTQLRLMLSLWKRSSFYWKKRVSVKTNCNWSRKKVFE